MSDIIRMARAQYPNYDQLNEEAGRIKEEYVAAGGDPMDVYSPERMDALAQGGPQALEDMPSSPRPDGSIAGPYVPTEMALTNNMVQPQAVPAVLAALMGGVNTVSSGVDRETGKGFAIGRGMNGEVCKVMK